MTRALFINLSRNDAFQRFVIRFPLSRRVSRRFVAGETLAEAVAAIQRLNAKGLLATFDHLGENVKSAGEARAAADAYTGMLDAIEQNKLRSNVSLKPTHMGLDFGDDVCLGNIKRVAAHARHTGNFVRIDMEGSPYTQRTLDLYRALRADGADNVGIVIQAYLFRSADDIAALAAMGARVRLFKCAYKEPDHIAFPRKANVDASFRNLISALWSPEALAAGAHAALATHDERIIAWAIDEAAKRGVAKDRFEFQMLYGIRRERQEQLARDGYTVRVYVPYGTQWYPYFMRRLAERPANVLFLIKNLFEK
ncbi:MAG: proline dehydrogenase family protein [Chloroflexi bacterium]|nr:proline dehydrogenase family protein [Chloroflexota bacterium]